MNALSQLQQQVIGRLTAIDPAVPSLVAAVGAISWITEDVGDLANIVARAVANIGIVGIVVTPGGEDRCKLFSAGVFPISFVCPIIIQIQENVTVNRGTGTNIPALDLVQFVMRRLHMWSPTHQRAVNQINLDETPYSLVQEAPILTYNVRFNAKITIQ